MNMTRCHCLWGVDKFRLLTMVGSYEHDSVTLLISRLWIRWGILHPHELGE